MSAKTPPKRFQELRTGKLWQQAPYRREGIDWKTNPVVVDPDRSVYVGTTLSRIFPVVL
jgi:hypothetical protein